MNLLELAERCEKATGPDRSLDVAIDHVLPNGQQILPDEPLPLYTASIDAAMTLVPEGYDWSIEWHEGVGYAYVAGIDKNYWGRTPALALCAAALKARAA